MLLWTNTPILHSEASDNTHCGIKPASVGWCFPADFMKYCVAYLRTIDDCITQRVKTLIMERIRILQSEINMTYNFMFLS